MKRALGVDPGIRNLGFAVVEEDGSSLSLLEVGSLRGGGDPFPAFLAKVRSLVVSLGDRWSPDLVCVESLLYGRNVSSAALVWQVRGVVLLASFELGRELVELSPKQVKSAVCAHGGSSKEDVRRGVSLILGLDERRLPKSPDALDAIAVAVGGLAIHRLRGVVG